MCVTCIICLYQYILVDVFLSIMTINCNDLALQHAHYNIGPIINYIWSPVDRESIIPSSET